MYTGIVAREPELEYLNSCLRRVERSQAIGVLISGEAGIGKTTLLHEFSRDAISQGFIVCRCFLDDQGPTRPFEMWRIAIREWINQAEAKGKTSTVAELVGQPWQALSGLAPDVFARYGWIHSTQGERRSDPRIDSVERQLGEEIMLFIAKATTFFPTVLVVDNLHSADRDSSGLLAEVSPDVSAVPAMFLATFRPDRLNTESASPHLIRTLEGPGDMPIMRLGALSVYGVQQYLSHHNMVHDIGTASALHCATGGHPLLLSELKPWKSAGALPSLLGDSEGVYPSTGKGHRRPAKDNLSGDLSEALAAIVERRLQPLDEQQHSILGTAALLGIDLTTRALVSCTRSSRMSVVRALREAVKMGIIEPRAEAEGSFQFRHSLIREAIAARVPGEERKAIHMRVADYLFSLVENPGVDTLRRISDHYFHSGADRGIRKGIQMALSAAHEALRIGAWREAMQILNALEHGYLSYVSDAQKVELDIAGGIVLLYLGRKPEAYWRVANAVTRIAEGTEIRDASELILRPEIADLYGPEYPSLLRMLLPAITRSHWLHAEEQQVFVDRRPSSVLSKFERVARFQQLEDLADNARSLRGSFSDFPPEAHYVGARAHSSETVSPDLHAQSEIQTEMKTRHLIAELYETLYSNPQNAQTVRQLSDDALTLARETKNRFLIAEAFRTRFTLEMRSLNIRDARRACEAGLESYPAHDPLLFGRIQIEALCGETDVALRYLERLKSNGGSHEDGPAVSLITRAGALHALSMFDSDFRARRGQEALGILERLTTRGSLPAVLDNQVNALRIILGAYEDTIDSPKRAYERLIELDPSPLVSIGQIERVRMLCAGLSGDQERVVEHHQRAMEWYARLEDKVAPPLTKVECADMLLGGRRVAGTRIVPNSESRKTARNLLQSAYSLVVHSPLHGMQSVVYDTITSWGIDIPEMRRSNSAPLRA